VKPLRLSVDYKAMGEASDKWQLTHPPVDGDDRSPLEAFIYGLINECEFWKIINDGEPDR
jgi:hypothetical protein